MVFTFILRFVKRLKDILKYDVETSNVVSNLSSKAVQT